MHTLGSFILSHRVPEDWRAQAEVFNELFYVFLTIGTLVGVVVVGYTLYHAYRARGGAAPDEESFQTPVVGELPSGQTGPKSKKLFVSFGISAVIVISLVSYSYFLLLEVEQGPTEDVDAETAEQMQVEVVGIQFGWRFHYPNGLETFNELRVPQGEVIRLTVTSADVWHNFGIPELRVKADAIPGQEAKTWFIASEPGTYTAKCYELCGRGHSDMTAEIIVMENEEFTQWYENQSVENDSGGSGQGGGGSTPEGEGGDSGGSSNHRIAAPAEGVAA
jgi:cytochrome c oxidase subunit 2